MKNTAIIFGGMILVAIAFLVQDSPGEIWNFLFAAMAGAVFFQLLMVFYYRQENGSRSDSRWIAGIVLGLVAMTALNGLVNYRWSVRTIDTMDSVRTTIDRAMLFEAIQTPLLESLESYYRENSEDSPPKRFIQRYGSQVTLQNGEHLFIPDTSAYGDFEEYYRIYLSSGDDTELVELVGQSFIGKGWNPKFRNRNGQSGKIQVRATLTEEGVSYVREN